MKIIDETPDPSVVKQIVCKNCGLKIEYVPNDVVDLAPWSDGGTMGFKCPNEKCKKSVIVRSW